MKKRLISLLVTLAMAVALVPPAMAETNSEELQTLLDAIANDDPSLKEECPNGIFEIGNPVIEMDENAKEPARIYIMRHGGTDGEVTVSIKLEDYSAEYGKDYYVKLSDGIFAPQVEKNADSVPLMSLFGTDMADNPINSPDATYSDYVDYFGEEKADRIFNMLEEYKEKAAAKQEGETIFNTSPDAPTEEETAEAQRNGTLAESPLETLNRNVSQYTGSGLSLELSDTSEDGSMDSEDLALAWEMMNEILPGTDTEITFADGEVYKEILVYAKNNSVSDGSRTFALLMDGAENAYIAENRTATVTISDDEPDEASVVSISSETADEVVQGDASFDAVITRRGAAYKAVTARILAVTDSGSVLQNGTVLFMPTNTRQTVTIPLAGLRPEDRTITISLLDGRGTDIDVSEYTVSVEEGVITDQMRLMASGGKSVAANVFGVAGTYSPSQFIPTIDQNFVASRSVASEGSVSISTNNLRIESGPHENSVSYVYTPYLNLSQAMLENIEFDWNTDDHQAVQGSRAYIQTNDTGETRTGNAHVASFKGDNSGTLRINMRNGSTNADHEADDYKDRYIGDYQYNTDKMHMKFESRCDHYVFMVKNWMDMKITGIRFNFRQYSLYVADADKFPNENNLPGTVDIVHIDGNTPSHQDKRYAGETISFSVVGKDDSVELEKMQLKKAGSGQYIDIDSSFYDLKGNTLTLSSDFFIKYKDYIDFNNTKNDNGQINLKPVFKRRYIKVTLNSKEQLGGIKMTTGSGDEYTVVSNQTKDVILPVGEDITLEQYAVLDDAILTDWSGAKYDPNRSASDPGSEPGLSYGDTEQHLHLGYFNYSFTAVYTKNGTTVTVSGVDSNDGWLVTKNSSGYTSDGKAIFTTAGDGIAAGRIMMLEAGHSHSVSVSNGQATTYVACWTVKTLHHKWYGQTFCGDYFYYEPVNGDNYITLEFKRKTCATNLYSGARVVDVYEPYDTSVCLEAVQGTVLNPPTIDSSGKAVGTKTYVKGAQVVYGRYRGTTDSQGIAYLCDPDEVYNLYNGESRAEYLSIPYDANWGSTMGQDISQITAMVTVNNSTSLYVLDFRNNTERATTTIDFYGKGPYPGSIELLSSDPSAAPVNGVRWFNNTGKVASVPMDNNYYGFNMRILNITNEHPVKRVVLKVYDKNGLFYRDLEMEPSTSDRGYEYIRYIGDWQQDSEGVWGYKYLQGNVDFPEGCKIYVDIIGEKDGAEFSYGTYETGMTFLNIGLEKDIYMPQAAVNEGGVPTPDIVGNIAPSFNFGPLSVSATIKSDSIEVNAGVNIGLINEAMYANDAKAKGKINDDAPKEVKDALEKKEKFEEAAAEYSEKLEEGYTPNEDDFWFDELADMYEEYSESIDTLNQYTGSDAYEPLVNSEEPPQVIEEKPQINTAKDIQEKGQSAGNSLSKSIQRQFSGASWLKNIKDVSNYMKTVKDTKSVQNGLFQSRKIQTGAGLSFRVSTTFGITIRFKWSNTKGEYVFDRALAYASAAETIGFTYYQVLPTMPIPVYFGADVTSSVGMYNGITAQTTSGKADITMTDLENENSDYTNGSGKSSTEIKYMGMVPISLGMYLYVGAGVRSLLSLEFGGGFLQQFNLAWGSGQKGTGMTTFYGKLSCSLVIFNTSWQFAQKSWSYELYNVQSALMDAGEDAFKLDNMTVDDTVYGNDFVADNMSLMSVPKFDSTQFLLENTPNIESQIVNLDDGRYLLVYQTRTTSDGHDRYNQSAVYFSIYENGRWQTPQLISDSGTNEYAPKVSELDDSIVISFSAAGRKFTAEDFENDGSGTFSGTELKKGSTIKLLSNMDLYSAVLKKSEVTAENVKNGVKRITDNSDFDFSDQANGEEFMGFGHEAVGAVKMSDGNILVFYDTIDYNYWLSNTDEIDDIKDLLSTPSYMMYRIYEPDTGTWRGSEAYLAGERGYIDDEIDWGGQRIVDMHITSSDGKKLYPMTGSADVTTVKDADGKDAVVIAYVLDPDNDYSATPSDKSVCVVVMKPSDGVIKTSAPVQLTTAQGAMSLPKFSKTTKNGETYTYLTWSQNGNLMFERVDQFFKPAKLKQSYIDAGENADNAVIFEKTNENGVDVYKFKNDEYTPATAVMYDGDNPYSIGNGYSVAGGDDGNIYTVWAQNDGARQVFYISALTLKEEDGTLVPIWSKPKQLDRGSETDSDNSRDYVQSPAICVDGKGNLMISHNAYDVEITHNEDGNAIGNERTNTAFAVTRETASGSVDVEDIAIPVEYPSVGEETTAKITVVNNGILPAENVSVKTRIVKADEDGNMYDVTAPKETTVDEIYVGAANISEYSFTLTEDMVNDAMANKYKYYILSEATEGGYTDDTSSSHAEIKIGSDLEIKNVLMSGYKDREYVLDGRELKLGDTLKSNTYIAEYSIKNKGNVDASAVEYSVAVENMHLWESENEYVNSAADDDELKENLKVLNKRAFFSDREGSSPYLTADTEVLSDTENIKAGESADVRIQINSVPEYMYSDQGLLSYILTVSDDTVLEESGKASFTGVLENVEEDEPADDPNPTDDPTPTVEPTGTPKPNRSSGGGGSSRTRPTATPKPSEVPAETAAPEETPLPDVTAKPADSSNWFTDVPQSAWYYEPVKYAFAGGLMSGVSDTEFAPEADITRGMFVTVLHRIDGEPETDGDYSFTDVPENAYYADATRWGSANGIIAGYSDTEFAPDDKITREQMAAILWRYAKYKDADVSVGEDTNILSYTDALDISEYAIPAIGWVCGAGIITGFEDNTLRPKDNTTRAQAAVVFGKIDKIINQ